MDAYEGKVAEGSDKKKTIKFAIDVDLDKCLDENEILGYLATGFSSDRDALIVVTNKRVFIFYRSTFIKAIEKVELPITHIISYVKNSGMLMDTLIISTADEKYKITYVDKESASEFINHLGMSINKNSDISYTHSDSKDIISSLEKLSSLLEKGYITREEFDLEKGKLLSSNKSVEPISNNKDIGDEDVSPEKENFNNEDAIISNLYDRVKNNSEADSNSKNEIISQGSPWGEVRHLDEASPVDKKSSNIISKIVVWFFSIAFMLLGLVFSVGSIVSAAMMLAASLLLLHMIYGSTRIKIKTSYRLCAVLGLVFASLYFLPTNSTGEKENKRNDAVVTPDSELRDDAYQLISQSVEGALVFESVKKTMSDPLSYVVYFKTNVPAMMSKEGAVFLENEAYFRNVGRTEAWQVIYCRDEVMKIKEKYNIFMLSAQLLDYSGKHQSTALCN